MCVYMAGGTDELACFAPQGIQETLCLDCAVAREDTGHSLRILCSRNIRELEHRAKYLEQHSLLKGRTDGVHLVTPVLNWPAWICGLSGHVPPSS